MALKISQSSYPIWIYSIKSDYSLFTKGSGSYLALLVYMDDIVLIGPSYDPIQSLKKFLHSRFKVKDLGTLRYFLGLEIVHSSKGIILSQRQYTLQLLEGTGFLAFELVNVPMDQNLHLSAQDGDLILDAS